MRRKNLKFNTISSRFTLIVSVAVVGCMLAVQLASYFILRQTVKDHGEATMRVANESISLELEDDYYTLLQVSQLMIGTGMAGKEFDGYLQADSFMKRFEAYANTAEMLQTITFSTDSKLAVYYDIVDNINYTAASYTLEKNFEPENIPQLKTTTEITYHPVHKSLDRYSDVPVASLSRTTNFLGDEDVIIYVEKQTNVDALLEEYRSTYRHSFAFLQIDGDGNVCYSSSEEFPVGMRLEQVAQSETNFGRLGNHFWSARRSEFGGHSVLLLSQDEFYGDMYLQMRFLLLAVFVSAVLTVLAVVLLDQLIIKKNKILQQEIERVGEGNLSKVSQRTGLQDYDLLLERFDWMLEQLHQQMRAVEAAERRSGDIEREILYYQINPHFLLNSLNSAYWQARMNIQGGIDQYLAQLTGILRYSLGKDTEHPTLNKEVEILRLYLQLQMKRYDFTYSLEVEEGDYLNLATPRLFMQPIVENSIEHGMDEGDNITIRVYREGDWACVHIWDNGVGMSEEILQTIEDNMEKHNSRAGIGLRYVKTVITAMYGDKAQMTINSKEGEGTDVQVRLPLGEEFPLEAQEGKHR